MHPRIILALSLLSVALSTANAQSWLPPAEEDRCPSRWGAGDERGSANHMGPVTVLRAANLINSGEVVELGHVLHEAIPLGNRHFDLYLKPMGMNPQSNQRGSNEEIVVTELGQVGTQFDGFSHQTIGDTLYNCFRVSETLTRSGFTNLGIEKVGMLMTRGVLLERMKLDELAAREVYEFAFVMQPLKIRGATGSTVAPAAIY